jgi:hypothetical protein
MYETTSLEIVGRPSDSRFTTPHSLLLRRSKGLIKATYSHECLLQTVAMYLMTGPI